MSQKELREHTRKSFLFLNQQPRLLFVLLSYEFFFARDKGKKAVQEDRVLAIPDLAEKDEALQGGRYS